MIWMARSTTPQGNGDNRVLFLVLSEFWAWYVLSCDGSADEASHGRKLRMARGQQPYLR